MGFSHKPIISCQTSMCQWQYLYHILPQISRPHTITSDKWGQITRYGIEIRTRDHFRHLHPIEIRHIVYMTLEQSRVINYIQIKCICGEITRFTRNQIHFKLKLTTGLTKTADSHLFFCFKIFFTRNPAGHKKNSFFHLQERMSANHYVTFFYQNARYSVTFLALSKEKSHVLTLKQSRL